MKIILKIKRLLNTKFRTRPYNLIGIAEYPKSGVTMFEFGLIAGMLNKYAPDIIPTWFNKCLFIDDIHLPGKNNTYLSTLIPMSFQKTHKLNDFSYSAIIVIKRDPTYLFPSYYEYAKKHFSFKGSFKSFLVSKKYGLFAWVNYMDSYSKLAPPWQRIITVDYDELVENSKSCYERIFKILGFHDPKDIEAMAESAKHHSSRGYMRNSINDYFNIALGYKEEFVGSKRREVDEYWTNDNAALLEKYTGITISSGSSQKC